jgi:uncharacterized protein (DUF736 family)
MKVLIGCPIYKRDWILSYWISCLVRQTIDMSNIGFVFEVSPDDRETILILESWKKIDTSIPYFEIKIRKDIPHFQHENNGRQWNVSKYENMVNLRNSLLKTAREIEPDYYFSLDSDILLINPKTIELLISHINSGADGVNPLMFMTPVGVNYPSVMTWKNDGSNRAFRLPEYNLGSYFKTDVIMAAKMMSKKLYSQVDYSVHPQGEDVGWSWNCKLKDMNLYCASYIYAPHIMSPIMLEQFKSHGDERQLYI